MPLHLWDWWDYSLTDQQRATVMAYGHDPLPTSTAAELATTASFALFVASTAPEAALRLTPEVVRFAADRDYDRRTGSPPRPDATGPGLRKVELFRILDCPRWVRVNIRLAIALTATGHDDLLIHEVVVHTPEDAQRHHFPGSPTVRFNGIDAFPSSDTPPGLACRVYRRDGIQVDGPSVEDLIEAISALDRDE